MRQLQPEPAMTVDQVRAETSRADDRSTPPSCGGLVPFSVLLVLVRALDLLIVLAAGLFASVDVAEPQGEPAALAATAATLLVTGLLAGLGSYTPRTLQRLLAQILRLCLAVAGALVILFALLWLATERVAMPGAWAARWAAYSLVLLGAQRTAVALGLADLQRRGRLARRVAVVGRTLAAARFVQRLAMAGGPDVACIGIYDPSHAHAQDEATLPAAGDLDALIARCRRERIDVIVLAVPPEDLLRRSDAGGLRATLADLVVLPEVAPTALLAGGWEQCGPCPVVVARGRRIGEWQVLQKAALDRCFAALLLLVLSPFLLAVALAVRLDSPGPSLFRQRRVGLNNAHFEVLKFRSMHHAAADPNADQLTIRDDPRITPLGHWLRRTSIDELPQLINVLRGEMSLVGPRPHPLGAKAAGRLYPEVVADYAQRHRVKPGITGWAQVNGWRGDTSTEEQIRQRVQHDLAYIDNWSIWLDLRILLLTVTRELRSQHAF